MILKVELAVQSTAFQKVLKPLFIINLFFGGCQILAKKSSAN